MRTSFNVPAALGFAICLASSVAAQQSRSYRLNAVDLKQQVIWGAECHGPQGRGLAFGGQDQDAEDGRPHTSRLVDGKWTAIHHELRARNPLQEFYERSWSLRQEAKITLAVARAIYFKGLPGIDEVRRVDREVTPRLSRLTKNLVTF